MKQSAWHSSRGSSPPCVRYSTAMASATTSRAALSPYSPSSRRCASRKLRSTEYSTSSLSASLSTAPARTRSVSVGLYIRTSQTSTRPTPSVCATGYLSLSRMATSRYTPQSRLVAASGWRCRYAPSAWTRLPSAVSLHTGVIRALSRVAWVLRSGCRDYVHSLRIPPRSLLPTASMPSQHQARYSSSHPRATSASSPKVLPFSTSPSTSTPHLAQFAWVVRLVVA